MCSVVPPFLNLGIQRSIAIKVKLNKKYFNYISRTAVSYIRMVFGPTGNSDIRSADPDNLILEPNMK